MGRRDRLPPGLLEAIEAAESITRQGTRLHLRIAIDYSSRDALAAAAASFPRATPPQPPQPQALLPATDPPSREAFAAALARAVNAPVGTRDVDLLIRTGGERRLSDFLLWESAYAELLFTDRAWPDFTADDLESAVYEFSSRHRRFGELPAPTQRPPVETRVKARRAP